MSEALIGQLQAVEVKLSGEAKALQALIKKKKNKSKHYAKTLAEVQCAPFFNTVLGGLEGFGGFHFRAG